MLKIDHGTVGMQWSARIAQWENTLQDAQKVRSARPQRVKERGVPLGYVEGLNDARTTLADFFSIRLVCVAKRGGGLNWGPVCAS